ncbi:MAG: hypothetical protein JWQ14_2339 [Adhaeribacter sp.]|nr:hypothetical protein [Adhaeribacter sp.]
MQTVFLLNDFLNGIQLENCAAFHNRIRIVKVVLTYSLRFFASHLCFFGLLVFSGTSDAPLKTCASFAENKITFWKD